MRISDWSSDVCSSDLRIRKILFEPFQVPLHAHVGKIRHHMRHDLEPAILRQLERVAHSSHCVTSICVPCNIFVDTLYTNLNACATVGKHFVQVRLQAIIRAGLDSDANALRLALLREVD